MRHTCVASFRGKGVGLDGVNFPPGGTRLPEKTTAISRRLSPHYATARLGVRTVQGRFAILICIQQFRELSNEGGSSVRQCIVFLTFCGKPELSTVRCRCWRVKTSHARRPPVDRDRLARSGLIRNQWDQVTGIKTQRIQKYYSSLYPIIW